MKNSKTKPFNTANSNAMLGEVLLNIQKEFDWIETAFIEDNFDISPRLKLNYGLHFSMFNVQQTNYLSLQPRASMSFLAAKNLSFKL